MKVVKCSFNGCINHKAHPTSTDYGKPVKTIPVSDHYNGPAYCSIECAMSDGALSKDFNDRNRTKQN